MSGQHDDGRLRGLAAVAGERSEALAAVVGAVALATVGVLALAAASGTATAASDAASVVALVDELRRQLRILEAVGRADSRVNMVRAFGALVGLSVGVVVGSVATYIGWRR